MSPTCGGSSASARLQQRLAAVGEMAAGIAHEIRNPLASMSGSIQVLRQELSLSDEQAQLMDIVLRESERLNDTIKSFLAYARPQRSTLARLDIRKIVQDAALLLRNSAEVREHHTIAVDVPAEPVWCEADENQVRQVIWNLATNGLRAMGQGGQLRLAVATDKDGVRRDAAHRAGRRARNSSAGARPHLPAIPQLVREGQWTWPGHRSSHRHRLQRDHQRLVHGRCRYDRHGPAPNPRGHHRD